MTYAEAYKGRSNTIIENITTDTGTSLSFSMIDFEPYGNPSVSTDSSGRFATHEIIGGTTVRQKVGEDPMEITINGVCTETVAQRVNQLNKAKLVSINSDVIGGLIRGQIASTSTDPIDDGGGVNMDGGEFLYEFTINFVEVVV